MNQSHPTIPQTIPQTIHDSPQPSFQDYALPIIQAVIFVLTVYVDKFIRKRIWGKKHKEITRIVTMSILTLVLMLYNYSSKCQPEGISFQQCFYLTYNIKQVLHVIAMNTILFGYHIELLWTIQRFRGEKAFIRTAIFAPLLEQLLFRGVFFRSSSEKVSLYYLSLIFAISHFHKYIWKGIRGKQRNFKGSLFQLLFTFIFAVYSYYILYTFESVIPCIALHIYCNLLGPPIVRSCKLCGNVVKMLLSHGFCFILFMCYNVFYI